MAKKKRYIITVNNKPSCCEVGACGIQFAHGKAETEDARAAAWFREHSGYTVTEAAADGNAPAKE